MTARLGICFFASLLLGGAGLRAQMPVQPARVSGTVKDLKTGTPVRAAQIRMIPEKGGYDKRIAAETDAEGRFIFADVPPGRYTVTATGLLFFRPRRDAGPTDLTVRAEEERSIDIGLLPTGVISGRVQDENGDPLRSVDLGLIRSQYADGHRSWQVEYGVGSSVTTDNHGEYRFFNVAPGTYRVRASDATTTGIESMYYPGVLDPEDSESIRVEPGEERSGIDITMRRGAEFSVKFKLAGGADFGETELWFRRKGSRQFSGARSERLSDGSQRLTQVAPGTYELFAWIDSSVDKSDAFYSGTTSFTVTDADVDLGSWTVPHSVPVTGLVKSVTALPAGFDIREFFIWALDYNDAMPGGHFVSFGDIAQDGSFHISNISIGRFRIQLDLPQGLKLISARSGAYEVLDTGYVVTGDQAPLMLTIGGPESLGTVEGRVVDAKGNPVSGSTVALVPPLERQVNPMAFHEAATSESGAFTVTGILPGEYRVLAWEDIEPGAYQDPEFIKDFLGRDQVVNVTAGLSSTVTVDVIPVSN